MSTPLRLQLSGISKQYPAVRANDGVNLAVKPGQIHAVLGENGAGKSTLMKIIYGAVQPDEGQIRWNGELVKVPNPAQARKLGISMVYQHFSLFDTLTAAQNVWLGLDKSFSLAQVSARITEVAHTYGLDVDPQRPVHTPVSYTHLDVYKRQPVNCRIMGAVSPIRFITECSYSARLRSISMMPTLTSFPGIPPRSLPYLP